MKILGLFIKLENIRIVRSGQSGFNVDKLFVTP